jgi:hypothetical protein
VDWIDLAKVRNRWRALVNSVLNLRVPWNAGKLSSGLTSSGISSNALLHRELIEHGTCCLVTSAIVWLEGKNWKIHWPHMVSKRWPSVIWAFTACYRNTFNCFLYRKENVFVVSGSWNESVGIAVGIGLEDRGSIPCRDNRFANVQTGSGTRSASVSMGRRLFWSQLNVWIVTMRLQQMFVMALCLINWAVTQLHALCYGPYSTILSRSHPTAETGMCR